MAMASRGDHAPRVIFWSIVKISGAPFRGELSSGQLTATVSPAGQAHILGIFAREAAVDKNPERSILRFEMMLLDGWTGERWKDRRTQDLSKVGATGNSHTRAPERTHRQKMTTALPLTNNKHYGSCNANTYAARNIADRHDEYVTMHTNFQNRYKNTVES